MSNKSDMCKTDNKLKAKRRAITRIAEKRLGYILMIEGAKRKSLKAKRKQERQNKRRARHARNS